jgi:hypothetical protein
MSINRELSQFGSFVDVDDSTRVVGISTDVIIDGTLTARNIKGLNVPPGKTIYVTKNGNDDNSGLTVNDAKLTIKSAVSMAMPGDTVIIHPGQYIVDNPIPVKKVVTLRGTELRNCIITPKNPNRDIFYVENGVHITDLSFIGPSMTDGSAVIAFKPLVGVSTDRYFDAARLIRDNLNFIASETLGFLTSTDYKIPQFTLNGGDYSSCKDDIKDVLKAVCYDITRGGNYKCVGAGLSYYSGDNIQHIVGVKTETIDAMRYAAGIAVSCINNVDWLGNYQNEFYQIKDLNIQNDDAIGSNTDINCCSDVVSAIYSCVGVVTSIIENGLNVFGSSGITTTYPGNAGMGFTSFKYVTNASYDTKTGDLILTVPNYSTKIGDLVEIRDLEFEYELNGFPYVDILPYRIVENEFIVNKIYPNGDFRINIGITDKTYTYLGGGFVIDRTFDVVDAVYDHNTGITTITTNSSLKLRENDFVELRNLEFSCPSGAGTTTLYPTGNNGFTFRVDSVVGLGSTLQFSVNVGPSTIPHTYVSGGKVLSPYSSGVGPILQGPYIRNCTNFIPDSIGMKVDGFAAEPGDNDDVGVTGSMSVDSYTQYNQGGIGVSVTNGAYAQLVSIFTICNDIAIFTASGGQCDVTNSNSSFGNYGLVSVGVGDGATKSIYRYTGITTSSPTSDDNSIIISNLGQSRPYTGQVFYVDELYYEVESITIVNRGSGYVTAPNVSITAPTGPQGIRAEAIASIDNNGSLSSITLIGNGLIYRSTDSFQVTISGGGGSNAEVITNVRPLYYKILSATLPSAGISTVTIQGRFNSDISSGKIAYFSRQSLQIVSSHSFEFIGSGTDILKAKPALGGVTITENEIIKNDGGEIVYTSTDQDGNFAIGKDVLINQSTGTIDGRAFEQSLINTVTPLIIALGGL